MTLPGRERHILTLLGRFQQLTAQHVHELAFHGLKSRTPCNRALQRLMKLGLVERIPQRIVGGSQGGSGQWVYQLSSNGMRLCGLLGKQRRRSVSFHALAVAETYIALDKHHRDGRFTVAGWSAEPGCWHVIAGVELRPDLRIDLEANGTRWLYWYEIDMGTEGQRQLRGKLEAYYAAWQGSDTETLPVFPKTVWLAVDEARRREIAWLVSRMPEDAQQLFAVTTMPDLANVLPV